VVCNRRSWMPFVAWALARASTGIAIAILQEKSVKTTNQTDRTNLDRQRARCARPPGRISMGYRCSGCPGMDQKDGDSSKRGASPPNARNSPREESSMWRHPIATTSPIHVRPVRVTTTSADCVPLTHAIKVPSGAHAALLPTETRLPDEFAWLAINSAFQSRRHKERIAASRIHTIPR
jgi:hypothetical protein